MYCENCRSGSYPTGTRYKLSPEYGIEKSGFYSSPQKGGYLKAPDIEAQKPSWWSSL